MQLKISLESAKVQIQHIQLRPKKITLINVLTSFWVRCETATEIASIIKTTVWFYRPLSRHVLFCWLFPQNYEFTKEGKH